MTYLFRAMRHGQPEPEPAAYHPMKYFLLTKAPRRQPAVIPSVLIGDEQMCLASNPRAYRRYSIQQLMALGLKLDGGIGTRK
jgi:hypothetical protein